MVRLRPGGLSRDRARVDRRPEDAGASPGLGRWFGHDPARWAEFRLRYEVLRELLRARDTVTFLFAAHDEEHDNAVALKESLESGA